MAVHQPRRAAIATTLVTVMQDDICEELLGRHKRKNVPQTWPASYCISNYHFTSRCLFFLYFFAFLAFSLSASPSSECSSKLLLCCSSHGDGNCIEPAFVTPADLKTIVRYHPLESGLLARAPFPNAGY